MSLTETPLQELQDELAKRIPLAHLPTKTLEEELDRRLRKPHLFNLKGMLGQGITLAELKKAEVAIQVSAESGDVTIDQILGESRVPAIVLPRHIAMKLCRDMGMGAERLSVIFNKRCHSTILTAVKTLEAKADDSPSLQAALDTIATRVAGILAEQP